MAQDYNFNTFIEKLLPSEHISIWKILIKSFFFNYHIKVRVKFSSVKTLISQVYLGKICYILKYKYAGQIIKKCKKEIWS
jgi:hypothetical protein